MRIAMLTLRNFRSHQATVLQLDRFNFIRGPNGCGKLRCQRAVSGVPQLGLTGGTSVNVQRRQLRG
jgi:predicted ATPase